MKLNEMKETLEQTIKFNEIGERNAIDESDCSYFTGKVSGLQFALELIELSKQPTLNENQQRYLKTAIDEIERSMLGNKDRDVNELYLYNAIRFIKAVLKQEEE